MQDFTVTEEMYAALSLFLKTVLLPDTDRKTAGTAAAIL
jgi:hypothetical protein